MKNLISCVVFLSALFTSTVHQTSFAQLDTTTTLLGSDTSDPTIQDNVKINISCFDISDHKVSFVATAPGVQLEVLD